MWREQGYSLEEWKDRKIHDWILQDNTRNDAFKRSISEVVNPGDVVLDLGSGTGYLSFLALQTGVRKVYGVEYHQNLIEEARERVRQLRFDDKVCFVHGYSMGLDCSAIEPVDVIVSETLGFMGIGEGIVKYIADARTKWLKSDGKTIPQRIELYFAPVFHPDYDGREMKQAMCEVKPEYIKGETVKIAEYDFLQNDEVNIYQEVTFELQRAKINGFVGWFKVQLSPNVALDTSPFSPQTCWHQMFYPIEEYEGKKIKLIITSEERRNLVYLNIKNYTL